MRLSGGVFIIFYLFAFISVQGQWASSSPFGGALLNSHIAIGGKLLVGTTTNGVFVSSDNGVTWTPSSTGLTNQDVRSFAVIGSNLFAGTFGGGVFLSTNNGTSWTQVSTGLTNPFVRSIISVGSNLFVATEGCFGCVGGGIFLSTDSGATWTAANNGIPSIGVNCLATIGSYVFAGSIGSGVFRSSDSGVSWVAMNSGLDVNVTGFHVSGGDLYVATQRGVYLSKDNGNLWKGINAGLLNEYTNSPINIYSLSKSGIYLFASSSNTVYISTNNGGSWSIVLNGSFNKYVFINNAKVFVSSASGFFSQPLLKFPAIYSIKPLAGTIGSKITIKGSGFSSTSSENSIYLSGVSAVANKSTNDSLTFIIPPGAVSSSVSISVNGQFASTTDTLSIIPNIDYFVPDKAPPRSRIKIGGTGFNPLPTKNFVSVNGKSSFVALSSTTSLEVIVPDSASIGSGNISITVKGYTGSSPFTVTQASPLPNPGGSGNISWTQPIRAGFITSSMAIDSKRNLFFTGELANYGGLDRHYFNYSLFPGYSFDSYLIKSDTSYKIKWRKVIKSWSSTSSSFRPSKIQTDKDDNIILVGSFANSITIDSLTVTIPGIQSDPRYGLLIAKISTTGKLLWYSLIKTSSFANAVNDLKIDTEGNINFAGTGNGTWDFYSGSTKVQTIGAINSGFAYFTQYSSKGEYKWVKSLSQGYDLRINGLEVDKYKNIYITGSWYGYGNIESVSKVSSSEDIIIAKFDSLRKLVWLKQIGASNNNTQESGNDIAQDKNLNSLYVTGSFVSGDFGSGVFKSDDQNIFLARYSFNGDLIWVKKMGSWSGAASFTETGNKLIVDKDGFIYLGGVIGPLSLGFDGVSVGAYRDPTNSNFFNDGVIAKFAATGKLLWAQHFGDPNFDDYLTSILKDDKNNLYLAGAGGQNAIFGKYQRPFSFGQGFVCKIRDQKENFFELSASSFQIEADKDLIKLFQIFTDQGWTLSSNVDWLSTNFIKGKGNSEVILSAKANNSTQRSGVIVATSDLGIIIRVNVQQSGSATPIVTSVSSSGKIKFKVYPNPANDKLNLDTDLDSSEFQIEITDFTGRKLVNTHLNGFEIDIKSLPSGMYFLKVNTSTNQFVLRFVKL